jgi:hypothetical protein
MIEIDKDKFKIYMNEKYVDRIRVDDIKSITVGKVKYHKDQFSKDSVYHDVIDKNGFIELLMIKPTWSGWKAIPYRSHWMYRDMRDSNRFNLHSYQKWLVDVRDKKLESILEL